MGISDGIEKWSPPDYKKYKVEDVKKLREYERQLAEFGLKDPWTRNYVWKYINRHTNNGELRWYQCWNKVPGVTRGMAWGVIAVCVYIASDQLLRRTGIIKKDSGHH